jgi:hypothetical protein
MHIAIVGAGIAGLACARQLRAKGHAVTVFEKSPYVGGRIVTYENELGSFDYGAQFFTALSDGFKREVSTWREAGVAAPWHGKLVRLENGAIKPARASTQRFVAIPGMGELSRFLARDLDVRTGHGVRRIDVINKSSKPQWMVTVQADGADEKTKEGPFDAVAVATPANHAVSLLKAVPTLSTKAEKAGHVASWSLMLAFNQPLDLSYDGAWTDHPLLAWIACDASKPDRPEGERWIALARVEWSTEHLKDTPARARDALFKAFQEATGKQTPPVHAVARLWSYAQSTRPLTKSCLWDEKLKVGACGDWFTTGLEGSGQIEHAFMSGLNLAKRIAGND